MLLAPPPASIKDFGVQLTVDGLDWVGRLAREGRLWNYAALIPLWSKRTSDPEEIVAPGIGYDDGDLGIVLLLATMFVLVEMTDTVRIPPWQFERKLNDAITEELNKKLANKVVYNVGLCICLYDITKLEDSYIFPGDGASHTKVHFRYVVFHPFLDEILVGEIKGCSLEGVHVSLGFFDDILIPPESIQQPAKFDEMEQVWVWEYETEEGAHDLYMDMGEEIRFRVVDENFIDTSPTGPSSVEPSTSSGTEETQKKEAPYTIVGSISEPGLGLLSWWTNS